eukprot:168518_1
MDLTEYIETINVLNMDEEQSSISSLELVTKEKFDASSYLTSDADEELLVLIEFKQLINLHSIKLYALSHNNDDMSPPKEIHIFKIDNLSVNFDDIESMKSSKIVQCSKKKLRKGQLIKVKDGAKTATTFINTKYFAIYIKTNQNDTETTYLNSIKLKGNPNEADQNRIIFEEKGGVITSFDLPSSWKNSRFNSNNEHILFDTTDTKNKQELQQISKEFKEAVFPVNPIHSEYLLFQNKSKSEKK